MERCQCNFFFYGIGRAHNYVNRENVVAAAHGHQQVTSHESLYLLLFKCYYCSFRLFLKRGKERIWINSFIFLKATNSCYTLVFLYVNYLLRFWQVDIFLEFLWGCGITLILLGQFEARFSKCKSTWKIILNLTRLERSYCSGHKYIFIYIGTQHNIFFCTNGIVYVKYDDRLLPKIDHSNESQIFPNDFEKSLFFTSYIEIFENPEL